MWETMKKKDGDRVRCDTQLALLLGLALRLSCVCGGWGIGAAGCLGDRAARPEVMPSCVATTSIRQVEVKSLTALAPPRTSRPPKCSRTLLLIGQGSLSLFLLFTISVQSWIP